MKSAFLILLLLFTLSSCGDEKTGTINEQRNAGEQKTATEDKKVRIRVHKSDVLLSFKSEAVTISGDSVEVVLTGEVFPWPRTIPLSTKDTTNRSTPERLLTIDHQANLNDNEDLILSNWHPDEREEIRQLLSDPEVREINRTTVIQIRSMELYGWLTYRGYLFMLIGYNPEADNTRPVVTMKRIKRNWYLSNALSDDDVTGIIWTAHNGYGTLTNL